MLLDEVTQQMRCGVSLAPYITDYLGRNGLSLRRAKEWLHMGLNPNTPLNFAPGPMTLLTVVLGGITFMEARRDDLCGSDYYIMINMLCEHGARIGPEMFRPQGSDGKVLRGCREILKAHHTMRPVMMRRNLIVLMAANKAHPDIARVLKRFLV